MNLETLNKETQEVCEATGVKLPEIREIENYKSLLDFLYKVSDEAEGRFRTARIYGFEKGRVYRMDSCNDPDEIRIFYKEYQKIAKAELVEYQGPILPYVMMKVTFEDGVQVYVRECGSVEVVNETLLWRESKFTYKNFRMFTMPEIFLEVIRNGKLANPESEGREMYLRGKWSRIATKLFGEKATTATLQKLPLKQKFGIKFAKTDFYSYYKAVKKVEGVTSCMSHDPDWYSGTEGSHPLEAYESDNCCLALVWDVERNVPTGRAVCMYDEDGISYYRAYGRSGTENALDSAGLCKEYPMGLHLKKVRKGEGYLCPYVDGADGVRVGDKWLVVSGDYDIVWCHESGTAGESNYCQYYDEYVSGNLREVYYMGSYINVCESALDYFRWVEGLEEYHHEDAVIYTEDCEYVLEDDAWYDDWNECWWSDQTNVVVVECIATGSSWTVNEDDVDDVVDNINQSEGWKVDGELFTIEEDEEAA